MRLRRQLLFVCLATALAGAAGCGDDSPSKPITEPPVPAGANVVLQWNGAMLQAIRDTKPGPPMTARAIAIVYTCMYDAWCAYDDVANGNQFGGELRRPAAERKDGFKSKAASYAAFRALSDLFPDAAQITKFRNLMTAMGYDPDDASHDHTTPAGIGNTCAAAILAVRHLDGSNQLGDLVPGFGAYADYTAYAPLNPAIRVDQPTPLSAIPFPDHWQQLTYENAAGATVTPKYIGPQWDRVTPFALTSPSQFRPGPPAPLGSTAFRTQCDELIEISANLTDEQKCIAEYWADGPSSELPPGHWCLFGQFVSERDTHTLDQDIKMFFALGNALMDAGIATWEAKRHFDYCRPITAIRYLFNETTIRAWGGPGQGAKDIPGNTWRPYQVSTFPTPPFPEYTSGHSAFSAAGAEILKRFTGSDNLGFSFTTRQGTLKAEPGFAPSRDIVIQVPTFSDAADQAGISRRYGGIHFKDADLASRAMGRRVGTVVWQKAEALWTGTANPFRGEVAQAE